MKMLLYCTKQPHKLYATNEGYVLSDFELGEHYKNKEKLNGKIVAECDFEVEEIKKVNYDCMLFTNTLDTEELINKSCADYFKLEEYLKLNWDKEDDLQNLDTVGKVNHIKNLHIFDEQRELNSVRYKNHSVKSAPQNMMKVYDYSGEYYILISIHPEELWRILKGEQKIIIRKKVLKEMLK